MPGKVKFHELTKEEKEKYLDEFYSMVFVLETKNEIGNFFKDLLTPSEMVMICRRIQIAQLLLNGNTHNEIREQLGVGYTTIAQVEKWLNIGHGGYKKTIREYNKKRKEDRIKDTKIFPEHGSFAWLRKKYPIHFFLANAIAERKDSGKKNKRK